MSEIRSFYVEPAAFGETMTITGPEHKHLFQVLRLRAGDQIRVLDGAGHTAECVIDSADKRQAVVHAGKTAFTPEPASRAVIALALSHAVRRGFFMEKAVELGAKEVWLWQGDHSQGKLPDKERDSWQAKMIAGVKQSGNPWLPAVRAFQEGIEGVIGAGAGFEHHILPWEVQTGVPMLGLDQAGLPGTTVYVIGPEGGFSERELGLLREAHFSPVSFGQRILRCETAATLCLGLHWWASQQPDRPDCPSK